MARQDQVLLFHQQPESRLWRWFEPIPRWLGHLEYRKASAKILHERICDVCKDVPSEELKQLADVSFF